MLVRGDAGVKEVGFGAAGMCLSSPRLLPNLFGGYRWPTGRKRVIHMRIGLRDPVVQPTLLLFAALALTSGCGDGTTEPAHPTVTGNWEGTSAAFGAVETWRLNLEESSDGTVMGTFSLRVERLVFSGTLSGTHAYPVVHLDFDMVFFGAVVSGTYDGQVTSPTTITGGYQRFDDPTQTLDLDRLGT